MPKAGTLSPINRTSCDIAEARDCLHHQRNALFVGAKNRHIICVSQKLNFGCLLFVSVNCLISDDALAQGIAINVKEQGVRGPPWRTERCTQIGAPRFLFTIRRVLQYWYAKAKPWRITCRTLTCSNTKKKSNVTRSSWSTATPVLVASQHSNNARRLMNVEKDRRTLNTTRLIRSH